MKRLLLVSLVGVSFGLWCAPVNADNITVISASTVDLNHGQSRTFSSIPPIDPGTKRVKLYFRMRSDSDSGGFAYGVNFYLNGTKIDAAVSRSKIRLLNKPLSFPYKPWLGVGYETRPYYQPDTGWIMIVRHNYSPYPYVGWLQDPQWPVYELAVEDLVYSDQNNTLRFDNDHDSLDMIIDDLTIGTYDNETGWADQPLLPFPDRPVRGTPFDALTTPDASVDANGGLVIQQGGEQYRIESIFSYPGGGYNLLGPGPSPEAEESAFASSREVTQIKSNLWSVQAEGQYYRVNRLVTLSCGKIRIKDTITNKGSSTLGLIVQHYLRFDNRLIQHVFMGGDPDASLNDVYIRDNPTLFVPLADGGIGLVVEDAVFRLQAQFFYDQAVVEGTGVRTTHLAIAGNQSYTMQWSIYTYQDPDGWGDYFDFVNFVRQDWDSNFLINGPYILRNPTSILGDTDQQLAAVIEGNNVHMVVLTSSFSYQDDGWSWFTDFYWGQPTAAFSAYAAEMNLAIDKVRRVAPQVKVLHKYHSTLNVLDVISNFPDSQVRDQDGNLVLYPGYRQLVFPTMTNSYGQGMFDMLESIMTQYDIDGLYWDEFAGAGYGSHILIPNSTFNRWDNHTALIDSATKQIVATAAKINLISDAWTKEAINRVSSYGGVLLANGAPVQPDYNAMQFPRFVETQTYPVRAYETNLYTPLCYTSDYHISQIVERLDMGAIPCRVSTTVVPFMSHLFPLTPIEIHRGWILAQERLITKYSGTYGWGYPVTGTFYRYNSSGSLVSTLQSSIPAEGAVVSVFSNGLTVFVRDDLGAEPATCQQVWQQGHGMKTDLNQDCYINWSDFAIFAGNWLDVGCVIADFNDDYLVDWADFAVFAPTWLACNDPQNMPPCIANW